MKMQRNLQGICSALAFALIPPQALAQNHTRPVQSQPPQHTSAPPPPAIHSAPPTHTAPPPPPPPRETTVHSAPPPPAMHTATPAPVQHTTITPHPVTAPAAAAPNRIAPASHFAAPSPASRPMISARPAERRVRVEARRPDGARVVVLHSGHGFVERPIVARPGFSARTYVAGGRSFIRVYREERFRGFAYHAYVPRLYFAPAFYGWAYDPWLAPVYFNWGWRSDPWFGYYGGYFRPAPVYRTPALWLTDFLLAENLKLAYEDRQQAAATAADASYQTEQSALTPEVRELVAAEVRRQIELEQQQSSPMASPVAANLAPPALDPNSRVVVVSMDLDVPLQEGQTCRLTPGDILYRTSDAVSDDGQIGVTVLSSKPGSCAANAATSIDLATLQDMHNDFRAHIDAGLAVLAQNQGKGGLPGGPSAGARLSADGDAQVDIDAASALMAQERAATGRP